LRTLKPTDVLHSGQSPLTLAPSRQFPLHWALQSNVEFSYTVLRNPETRVTVFDHPETQDHRHDEHMDELLLSAQDLLNAVTEMVDSETKETRVPSSFLLSLLLPADQSRDIIANMEMVYQERWLPKHGELGAKAIWWSNNLQFIARRLATPVVMIWGLVKAFRLG
jgi:hypothetical protein